MRLTQVSYVAALRETSVVFAAALGARVLREPYGGRRIVGLRRRRVRALPPGPGHAGLAGRGNPQITQIGRFLRTPPSNRSARSALHTHKIVLFREVFGLREIGQSA